MCQRAQTSLPCNPSPPHVERKGFNIRVSLSVRGVPPQMLRSVKWKLDTTDTHGYHDCLASIGEIAVQERGGREEFLACCQTCAKGHPRYRSAHNSRRGLFDASAKDLQTCLQMLMPTECKSSLLMKPTHRMATVHESAITTAGSAQTLAPRTLRG